jgi:hypothetical protein
MKGERPMSENGPEEQPDPIPLFIRRQLDNPPILPGENAREFKNVFYQIEYSAEDRAKTAADYLMNYQATVLIWNLQRTERLIVAVIRHKQLPAVAALIRRTNKSGECEPGSVSYREAHEVALDYFSSEEVQKRLLQRFAKSGYAPDAVEVEAFEQAFPQLTILYRQQATAQRQLLVFLKEIDRRNSRRAKDLRKVVNNVLSRAREPAKSGAN